MRRRQQQQDHDRTRRPPPPLGGKRLAEGDDSQTGTGDRRRPGRSPVVRIAGAAVALSAVALLLALAARGGRRPRPLPPSPVDSPPLRGAAGRDDGGSRGGGGRRVVAVGDIHGDREALARALQLANVVDRNNGTAWTGGSDVVVQIGDLLNKAEPRDLETLSYLAGVEAQARASGGGVVVTVGDHDLRHAPALWRALHPGGGGAPFPPWIVAAHVVDRTLFVHGSLSRSILDGAGGSLGPLLREAHEWLSRRASGDDAAARPAWIGRGDGPVWSRLYSDGASDEDTPQRRQRCDDLRSLLEGLSVDRMVVGHTVRREGISPTCGGGAWRIDVGLSRTETRAGRIGASEVLELSEGGSVVRVLKTEAKLKSWVR